MNKASLKLSPQYMGQSDIFQLIVALIPWLVLPFSPMISSVIGLLFLIVFAAGLDKGARVLLSLCVIIAASINNGDCAPHSDYVNYYRTYDKLLHNDLGALLDYGKGVEIVVPLYYLLLGKLLGDLSSSSFISLNILTSALLFYIWLEVYILSKISKEQRALCVGVALLFFHFWFAGWLVRQHLSSIFILYALMDKNIKRHIMWVILAVLTHASALIFYPITLLLLKKPKLGMILCLITMICFMYFREIIDFVYQIQNPLLGTLRQKMTPYLVDGSALDGSFIGAKNLVLTLILACFTFFYVRKAQKQWRYVILGLLLIYWGSFGVSNHFSLRMGDLFMEVAFGFFLFIAMRKQPFLLQIFALLYLINFVCVRTYFGDLTNTRIYYNHDIVGSFFYYLF